MSDPKRIYLQTINANGIRWISDEEKDVLDGIYRERIIPVSEVTKKAITELLFEKN